MAAHWALLALFVVGCQSWKLPAVPAGRRAQFYTRQSDGAYKYGFDTDEGAYQLQHADDVNEVHGQYGADGGRTEYTAGIGGFKVISQTKPSAASTRRYDNVLIREATAEELSRPVADTAAVAAAKAKFQRDYERAAAAAAAAPDINIITGAVPVIVDHPPRDPAYDDVRYDGPPAPIGPDGDVEETDEVKAAKAQILAAQEAAARAAAGAEDRDIITGAVPVIVEAPIIQDDDIRYTGPLATLDAQGNVQETAEVKAAKAQILAAQEAAAQAAADAPDRTIITGAVPVIVHAPAVQDDGLRYNGPLATLDAAGNVQETAEVKAAKAQILAAQAAAAQAAAAAPDRNIITGAVPVIVDAPVVQDDGLRYTGPLATLDAEGNVQETAEVKAAKAQILAIQRASAQAAADAPDRTIITGAVPVIVHAPVVQDDGLRYTGPLATLDAEGNVQETAEVRAVADSFRAAYNSAAAAAAAAPDINIITARPSAGTYSAGSRHQAGAGHHEVARQYRVGEVTVQESDAASSPAKYGYAYQ